MTTIAEIIGCVNLRAETIVCFDETSNRGGPMGKYRGLPVFVSRENEAKIIFGKTYLCTLEKEGSFYRAQVIKEVSLEDILGMSPDIKDELSEIMYNNHRDRFNEIISAKLIRDAKNEVKTEYEAKISTLKNEILALKNSVSETVSYDSITKKNEKKEYRIVDGTLVGGSLTDGNYSARINHARNKILILENSDGMLFCINGRMGLKEVLSELKGSSTTIEFCEIYDGILISS